MTRYDMKRYDPRIEDDRDFIEYEVRARFPARWDETAPAVCANVEDEIDRAFGEALRRCLQ